jgi:hypothetical protein
VAQGPDRGAFILYRTLQKPQGRRPRPQARFPAHPYTTRATPRPPATARGPRFLWASRTRSAERRSQRGCLIYSTDEGLETDDPARLGYRAPLIPLARCLGIRSNFGIAITPRGSSRFKKWGSSKGIKSPLWFRSRLLDFPHVARCTHVTRCAAPQKKPPILPHRRRKPKIKNFP